MFDIDNLHITLIASLVSGDHLEAIPWPLETARQVVEAKTAGALVLMGRGTQNAIQACFCGETKDTAVDKACQCLRYSTNVLISRQEGNDCPNGCIRAFSCDDAWTLSMRMARRENIKHICIIGGGYISRYFLPRVQDLFAFQLLDSDAVDSDAVERAPKSFGPFSNLSRATGILRESDNRFRFVELKRPV